MHILRPSGHRENLRSLGPAIQMNRGPAFGVRLSAFGFCLCLLPLNGFPPDEALPCQRQKHDDQSQLPQSLPLFLLFRGG
jgi:hypothetical protein